jgi:hypothetical protein
MARVRDTLAPLDLDPDKMGQFETGVVTLASLSHNLTTLVDDHDQWQAVDVELRRIAGNMRQDAVELKMSWPDLQAMFEPLYNSSSSEWVASFKRDSDQLDSAIATENPARIRRYFRRCRGQVGVGFHRVDLDLKRLCEDLRRVGEPLTSVMRMIV